MKRALIVQHVDYEVIGGFRAPIEAAGYVLEPRAPVDVAQAEWLDADLIVLMGGPMGVYETDAYPWLVEEIAGIRTRVAAGLPTLGICLGSQLIAAALGAGVAPGPKREVGFAPLTLTDAGRAGPLRHLEGVPVLHWHGDTFAMPDGAEWLASSALYRNQGFAIGANVLALQFHAEMGEDPVLETWIGNLPDYIADAGTSPAEIRAGRDAHGSAAVAAGRAMIAEWLAGL